MNESPDNLEQLAKQAGYHATPRRHIKIKTVKLFGMSLHSGDLATLGSLLIHILIIACIAVGLKFMSKNTTADILLKQGEQVSLVRVHWMTSEYYQQMIESRVEPVLNEPDENHTAINKTEPALTQLTPRLQMPTVDILSPAESVDATPTDELKPAPHEQAVTVDPISAAVNMPKLFIDQASITTIETKVKTYPVKRANPETNQTRGIKQGAVAKHLPKPTYPALSRRLGEHGLVILEIEVSADGQPVNIRVNKEPGYPRLVKAAINAARRASFTPALKNGISVPDTVLVPFQFVLE